MSQQEPKPEQVARFLEDFAIGETWRSQQVSLSEDEIISYAQVYDPQAMHTDPEAARKGPFGTLVASGWQIAALSARMFYLAGGYGKTPMVGLGIDELRWLKPVRPGDVLVVEREVVEISRSVSRPDRGTLKTRVTVRNQSGDAVMTLYTLARVPARTTGSG